MMDPNATLARIRVILAAINDPHNDRNDMISEHGSDLAELVGNMDQWLIRGGHLPTPWATAPRP